MDHDVNSRWLDDSIQFPRLIAEFQMAGGFTEELVEELCLEMDVTKDELFDIVERAMTAWEEIKERTWQEDFK